MGQDAAAERGRRRWGQTPGPKGGSDWPSRMGGGTTGNAVVGREKDERRRQRWAPGALEGGLVDKIASLREGLEVAMCVHGAGGVLNDGNCLHMQVAEHGIALPPAEQADEVAVDMGHDECHGAGGAHGLDGDVGRIQAPRRVADCFIIMLMEVDGTPIWRP